MDQQPKERSRLGSALTTLGGVLGVTGVIAWWIGLKATITPDVHNVVLIRSVLSVGGLVTFGLAVGLIVAGALIGRRSIARKNEGPAEPSALADPLLPDAFGYAETSATSTCDSKPLVEPKSSSSSSA
jgi:hypothetical protein